MPLRVRGALLAGAAMLASPLPTRAQAHAMSHDMSATSADSIVAPSGRMIVPMIEKPMIPQLVGVSPAIRPFLPGAGVPIERLPAALPRSTIDAANGDTISLDARLVRRTIAGKATAFYAYNGELPGPLIRMPQGATIYVRFANHIDLPSTIHWHGVRLDARSDGTPGISQPPVAPNESFVYAVHAPDAGIFWYHDHVREDIAQPMGLYGNLRVVSPRADFYEPASAEAILMLGDLLVDRDGVMPYGADASNFALTGRVGNVILVNGDVRYTSSANAGDVVRFFFTNATSARTFNLSFGGVPMKLVAADVSKLEREAMVPGVVIAPAQRYVVDVRFPTAGEYYLTSRIQSVDHFLGEFVASTDTLGRVTVSSRRTAADHGAEFARLHTDSAVTSEIAKLRRYFDKPVDHELVLTTAIAGLPIPAMQFMSIDTTFRAPVEWTDGMSDMNWLATTREVRWILRDARTGAENMDIRWKIAEGDMVKIRLYNDPASLHPMSHPIHIHGQRFLVLARDGMANRDMAWKDTEVIPVGSTVDILVDASNPGSWMLHCHIAEHLQAGMMMPFTVEHATR